MTESSRKLLGTVAVLLSVVVWAVAITAIYLIWLPDAPWWVLIAFFAVGGTSWFFPAASIIRWMSKPDPSRIN